MIRSRNVTWVILIGYFISIAQFMPVVAVCNDYLPGSQQEKMTFSEIMRGAPFWLGLTLSCMISVLPFYIMHCVWYIFLYPQYNVGGPSIQKEEAMRKNDVLSIEPAEGPFGGEIV